MGFSFLLLARIKVGRVNGCVHDSCVVFFISTDIQKKTGKARNGYRGGCVRLSSAKRLRRCC